MLYLILLYQRSSGRLIWRYPCEDSEISMDPLLLSSFFSAIQTLVLEINKKKSATFNNINMGNKIVQITDLEKYDLTLATIADNTETKPILRLHNNIMNLIKKNKQIFKNFAESQDKYEEFTQINEGILDILQTIPELLKNGLQNCK
jgi:hypothetical protein